MKTMPQSKCCKYFVPKDCCYISFTPIPDEGYEYSDDREMYTVRGEQVLISYNKKDEIIGIELLGSSKAPKPCQGWRRKSKSLNSRSTVVKGNGRKR